MSFEELGTNVEGLRQHFISVPLSEHQQKWDDLYKDNFSPWDRGVPSPALIDLLTERTDLLPKPLGKKPRALVPGCGKGYDVLLLSAFGYDAYGLDSSSRALEAARLIEREMDGQGPYVTREGVQKGGITWLAGDFFKEGFTDNEGKVEGTFDLIYDYTFLCALPPSLRPAWAKRYSELLAPEGRIVCLEFPSVKAPSLGGPPYALPPKIYIGLLQCPGEEMPYDEEGGLLEEKLGAPGKNGLVRIAHFHPKRTHKSGYDSDGKVTDWVGVWTHPNSS